MVELYWQALARDIAFTDYETHPLLPQAAEDLSRLSGFQGPAVNDDRASDLPALAVRRPWLVPLLTTLMVAASLLCERAIQQFQALAQAPGSVVRQQYREPETIDDLRLTAQDESAEESDDDGEDVRRHEHDTARGEGDGRRERVRHLARRSEALARIATATTKMSL